MADANDLFSREVVIEQSFEGKILTDLPLDDIPCCFDIYYPADTGTAPGVVVLVTGFPDYTRKQEGGRGLKDLPPYRSWARLLNSEGMAVVTYSCDDLESNLPLLIEHLRSRQQELGIDMERLGLWSCSGNGPAALFLLHPPTAVSAAVFLYSYLADLGDSEIVANAGAQFGFCNPSSNRGLVAADTPLFIVRAGRDQFTGLNDSIGRYVAALEENDCELEFVDYAEGVHGFDLVDESPQSVAIIRRLLEFMKTRLRV